jgi:hypothetical protein
MGSEVGSALRARRRWLLDQGLARDQDGRIVYARNLLQTLERRELAEVAARIASETGLGYAEIKQGDRLSGTYRRMLTLNSGRFALIERAHDFSLVPWRPVLERAKGQSVTGVVGWRRHYLVNRDQTRVRAVKHLQLLVSAFFAHTSLWSAG